MKKVCGLINVRSAGKVGGASKTNVAIFSDTITEINVRVCMMVFTHQVSPDMTLI